MKLTPQRGFVLLTFALVAAMSVATTTDPDLWWHLRTGELIFSQGIPDADVFSFTVPGRDWITHEWGSQALMWSIWSWFGAAGLIVTFTALIVATFGVAYRTSTARPVPTSLMVLLAAAAARASTAPRPQMLNLFLLAALILLLERVRQGAIDRRWIWAVVPLTLVWSNLHSGYLLGVVTVVVYAVGERLEARRTGGRPMGSAAIKQLPLVAGASFVAAALNPNGVAMWRYPFDTLGSDAMRTHIREWASPNFHSPWYWPFACFLVVTVVALIASPRKPGWTQGLLLFGTALAGLQSVRHIPLFAIVAIPIVAEQAEVAWDAARARDRKRRSMLADSRPVAYLTAVLAVTIAGLFLSAAVANNDQAIADRYPVAAVDALLDSELAESNGYNDYGWGGYLIWRDVPVFVDGRADVYGDDFLWFYFQAEDAERDWREPLDQFDVQWALVAPNALLRTVLAEAPDWTLVYSDEVADIFARCVEDCPKLTAPPA